MYREMYFFLKYDAQILRMLMYGSELWGFKQFAVIEQAHMFAGKQFVNVSVQTPLQTDLW